jgi:hypothetical protein
MANEPTFQALTPEELLKRIHQKEGMPTLYVSHSRIVPSFFDLRLFLGQQNVSPQGEQTIEEQVCIVMTPECAKLIADGILASLDKFQKAFGQIRSLPGQPITNLLPHKTAKTKK